MANPCNHEYINQDHFGDGLINGFYDDLHVENMQNINIDDVADCAQADIDLIGDINIAEYGIADLGIQNVVQDLNLNDYIANAQDNPVGNFDFDAFADNNNYNSFGYGHNDFNDFGNHHGDGGHHDGGNHDGGNSGGCGGGWGGGTINFYKIFSLLSKLYIISNKINLLEI